ncbi:unnamed protein product (macronuclear) [Paramecium tetraurelia]|uniref:Carbonic anhydrase n=1 Tax=Paramecium tetraurelia TaxID=5888 RepID=A0BLV3_PARTE|nr:uncharacterized protein GSPATT00030154001 [Paramecium tetraurelia]CAK59520.1 unnamed protein product [Paramecium tetraurelia]|eukprot:XP_001426918.1 hypothetical protein (macronuclear) [Paramecium tetraurelia strain d4-2]
MIFGIFALLSTLIWAETATSEVTRDYCSLPDPIYADGVSAADFGAAGWSYANAATWADFVVTCGGSFQSPIDIVTSGSTQESVQPQINYKSKDANTAYEEANKPYTKEYEGEYSEIEVTDASGSVIRYYAKQFHIHTPSEHTIDGKYYDLEIHFVHQAIQDDEQDCNKVKNKLTVFGIMFQESSSATDYDVFKPWFDSNATGEVESFDLNDFFSKMSDNTYYHYNGSLTTLPCSQTVNWVVFQQALPISSTQLKQFQDFLGDSTVFPIKHNNRPIQHLNGRKILKGTAIAASVTEIPDVEASFAQTLAMAILMTVFLIQ